MLFSSPQPWLLPLAMHGCRIEGFNPASDLGLYKLYQKLLDWPFWDLEILKSIKKFILIFSFLAQIYKDMYKFPEESHYVMNIYLCSTFMYWSPKPNTTIGVGTLGGAIVEGLCSSRNSWRCPASMESYHLWKIG